VNFVVLAIELAVGSVGESTEPKCCNLFAGECKLDDFFGVACSGWCECEWEARSLQIAATDVGEVAFFTTATDPSPWSLPS